MRQSIFDSLRTAIDQIDEYVEQESFLWEDPQSIYHSIEDIPSIDPIGDVSIREDNRESLYEDRWTKSFGIDASSTQTMIFTNGIMFSYAVAGYGVVDDRSSLDRSYEDQTNSICGINVNDHIEREIGDLKIRHIPEVDKQYNRWLRSATQKIAEIEQLEQEDLPGPTFIDGYIVPRTLLHRENETELARRILDRFKDIDHSVPQIGIAKSSSTRPIVREFPDQPWSTDRQFMSALLQSDQFSWTCWFEQKRQLGGIDESSYWFWIREPRFGGVYRASTTEEWASDWIQRKIVAEFARTFDVPQSILRADQQIHIGREESQQIRDLISDRLGINQATSYDDDVRSDR